jgi:hypothetical protein
MNKGVSAILYVLFLVFAFAIGSVVIRDGAEIVGNVCNYILNLFARADLRPGNARGFGSFVQLILIAVFVGWTIRRFRRK